MPGPETINLQPPEPVVPVAEQQVSQQPMLEQQGQLFNPDQVQRVIDNPDRTTAMVASRIGGIAEKVAGAANRFSEAMSSRRTASQVGHDTVDGIKDTYERGRDAAKAAGRTAVISALRAGLSLHDRVSATKENVHAALRDRAQAARTRVQQRLERHAVNQQARRERWSQRADGVRAVGRAALELGIGAGVTAAASASEAKNNALIDFQTKRSERLFNKAAAAEAAAVARKAVHETKKTA